MRTSCTRCCSMSRSKTRRCISTRMHQRYRRLPCRQFHNSMCASFQCSIGWLVPPASAWRSRCRKPAKATNTQARDPVIRRELPGLTSGCIRRPPGSATDRRRPTARVRPPCRRPLATQPRAPAAQSSSRCRLAPARAPAGRPRSPGPGRAACPSLMGTPLAVASSNEISTSAGSAARPSRRLPMSSSCRSADRIVALVYGRWPRPDTHWRRRAVAALTARRRGRDRTARPSGRRWPRRLSRPRLRRWPGARCPSRGPAARAVHPCYEHRCPDPTPTLGHLSRTFWYARG